MFVPAGVVILTPAEHGLLPFIDTACSDLHMPDLGVAMPTVYVLCLANVCIV